VLTSWSDGGAVVEASCDGLAGSEVRLRVQGLDRVWEKRATVLWVHKDHGVGLEFEPDEPDKKGIMQRVLDSMRAPDKRAAVEAASRRPVKKEGVDAEPVGKPQITATTRRRLRIRMETPAEVIRLDGEGPGADITTITDASSSGVLFTTNRVYSVGTTLLVRYPYPDSSLPRQQGKVVRVEMLPDGRRRVAVAFAAVYENLPI
jgi:hypothetical protein